MAFGSQAARLFIGVEANTSDAERGLDRMDQKVQHSRGIMDTALGVAAGNLIAGGISKGLDIAGEALIGYNARMEQASIGFTTLLGSADKASKFIKDLQTFANKTPFDFPGLQSAANQMLAMGFAAKDILPTLTAVGDATSALGLGSEAVQRATYALGQMKSAGRVNAQDMMQLTSMGIPAWQLLAKAMGKTVPEVRKLSEKGLIPAQKGIDAIVKGIEKGNMGGMMAAQAKTFTGAMSTINDVVMSTLARALEPFFEMISKGAIALGNFLQSDEAAAFFGGISDAIGEVVDIIKGPLSSAFGMIGDAIGVFSGIFGKVQSGIDGMTKGSGAAMAGFAETVLEAVGGLLAKVPPLLADLAQKFVAWIGPMIPPFLAALADYAKSMIRWIAMQIPVIGEQLIAWAQSFIDWIAPMIGPFLEQLATFALEMVSWLIGTGLPLLIEALGKFAVALIQWVGPMIPKIPGVLLAFGQAVVGFVMNKAIPMLVPALAKFGAKFIEWMSVIIPQIPTMILNFSNAILKEVGKLPGALGTWFTTVLVPAILKWGPKLLKAGLDIAGNLGKGIANGLIGAVEWGLNTLIKALNSLRIPSVTVDLGPLGKQTLGGMNLFNLGLMKLPRLKSGLWDVGTHAIPAILDPREMVVPAGSASKLRDLSEGLSPSGPGVVIILNIDEFHGTEDNMRRLSERLGEVVRYSTVRRSAG